MIIILLALIVSGNISFRFECIGHCSEESTHRLESMAMNHWKCHMPHGRSAPSSVEVTKSGLWWSDMEMGKNIAVDRVQFESLHWGICMRYAIHHAHTFHTESRLKSRKWIDSNHFGWSLNESQVSLRICITFSVVHHLFSDRLASSRHSFKSLPLIF